MPPIPPRYDSPQVQATGAPQTKVASDAPLSAFGGGKPLEAVGEAAKGVAQVGFKLAEAAKKRADEVNFMELDRNASAFESNISNTVRDMRGKDAAGASDYFEKEWRTQADKLREGAFNDEQKMMLETSLNSRYQNLNKVVQAHQSEEFRKYDLQETLAYAENAKDEAIENYNDPSRVELNLYRQRAAITKGLVANGVDENSPVATQMYKEAASKTHAGIISRMLTDGNDGLAQKYWNENEKNIDTKEHDNLKKQLEEGGLRGKSQRASDAIIARNADDEIKALNEAKDIKDPKLRDATEERVQRYFSMQNTAETQRGNHLFNQGMLTVDKDPRKEAIPPEQWVMMTPAQRQNIEERIQQNLNGGARKTDRATYYNLAQMAANNPDKFLNANMMDYSNKLDDSDFEKFADMQKEAKKGNKAPLDGFLTDAAMVNSLLTSMKIDPKAKPGTPDFVKADEFKQQLNVLAAQKAKELKRPLSSTELKDLANPLKVEYVVGKKWFGLMDETKRGFELRPEQEAQDVVVPKDWAETMAAKLRKRGKPATPDVIKRYYLRKIADGG